MDLFSTFVPIFVAVGYHSLGSQFPSMSSKICTMSSNFLSSLCCKVLLSKAPKLTASTRYMFVQTDVIALFVMSHACITSMLIGRYCFSSRLHQNATIRQARISDPTGSIPRL